MSLATLKKKTNAQYRTLSVNTPQFSLNGTHRSQGYVGQSTQSRFMVRTLMKGNVIKGHGGSGGEYPVNPIVRDLSTFNVNNASVVKPSVMSSKGMMDTKYRWIRRPRPFIALKQDNNNNLNTQFDYLTNLKQKTLNDINKCTDIPIAENNINCGCDLVKYNSNFKKYIPKSDPTKVNYIPQSEYLASKVYNNCQAFNEKPTPSKSKNTPFGCKTVTAIK